MIEIKREGTVVWSGKASGKQYKTVMQEDRVVLMINNASPVSFEIGDTVVVYNQNYKLNRPENISRINTSVGYSYEIEFEAQYYDLGKWMLYTLDKDNHLTEGDVFIMSDARVIIDLIVRNANRVSSGWSIGVVDTTEVQQYSYSNSKLLTVLQDLADKNQLEFWVDGKVINLTRRQPNTGLNFEHGKGKGLYQVNRERTDDRIINSVRILGGSRNLQTGSTGYGYRYLQPTGGNPLTVAHAGDVVEDVVEFANIYPRLIASVTYVGGAEYNVIRSTDIDFDLNGYLLNSSESAKIAFTSGQLAGFLFTIQSNGYDNATKQITFNRITDDPAYPLGVPNTVLRPAIGDKFVLLDIAMPQSYVTAAEAQLKSIGDQYLADYSVKRYNWRVSPTPKYILENNIEFPLGGVVRLKDSGLGVDLDIRIGGYVRDIVEPHLYEITLTNIITINSLVQEANKSDRFQSSVSKGLSSDGTSISKPTLASVTANGKVTPFDITSYGVYNTDVLGIPTKAPKAEDMRPGMAMLWFNVNAPSGSDPEPGTDFYIKQAKDANLSGIADGQVIAWSVSQNKFVAASFPSLAGYATQAWVQSQGYATQSWVNGQGFLTSESDTLATVVSRGSSTTQQIVVNGITIGYGVSSFLGFNIDSDKDYAFLMGGGEAARILSGGLLVSSAYSDNVNIPTNGIYSQGLILTGSHGSSSQWNTGYAHSQSIGNPHNTQFSEILNKPSTLGGYGITDAYTKTESDAIFKPIGYIPSWGEITGKPVIDMNVSANSIIQRNSSGDARARYFIDGTNNIESTIPNYMYGGLGAGYLEKFNKQAVNQFLEIPANGDTLQSILNRGRDAFGSSSRVMLSSDFSADENSIPSLGQKDYRLFLANGYGIYGMQLGVTGSGTGFIQQGRADGTPTAYNLILQPSGGSVGIGTATPNSDSKLDVNGKARATVIESQYIIPTAPPSTMETGKWYLTVRI